VAESEEDEEVGVGAVMTTVGVEGVSAVPSVSSPTVTVVPSSDVPSPLVPSTVTSVASGPAGVEFESDPAVTSVASGCVAPFALPFAPAPAPEDCPLTHEADGLMFETVGDEAPDEAVVALAADPVVVGSLAQAPVGGEFALGMVSPPVESACEGAKAGEPFGAVSEVADPPLPAAVCCGAPEPDEPPDAPAAAAAFELLPWTTAPLSPGWPTRTSTFTFFGVSCEELAFALAFPVWSEFPGPLPRLGGAMPELPGGSLWPGAFAEFPGEPV
jgi:hypothetical protein